MTDLPAAATWGRLQTFLAVYEGGSIRAAAETLHVTPPAVSAAISALEAALGTALFSKSGRGIVATDAGELLAEAAGAVHDADRGRLRIGAVATASEYVLPRLMASFADEHPQVELSLSVLPRDELFGDGAVRFIRQDIAPLTFVALYSRNGGDTPGADWW